jgi:hypothetical protein
MAAPQPGTKASYPGFIQPALATSIDRVPSGERWPHKITFDGYRVQVHLANEVANIFTRRGHDWTHRFKRISHDAWHIKAASAVIDGEIVVPAADGTTDLSVLQNELKGQSKKIVMVACDLLYLNGGDLRKVPLLQRKTELKKVIAGIDIQFSESIEIDGSTARRCSNTPASSASKASYPRFGTAPIRRVAATTGSRGPARGVRLSPTPASRSMEASGTASTSAGANATIWSTPARLTKVSTRSRPPTCGNVWRR